MDELQKLTKEKVTEYQTLIDEGNEKINDLDKVTSLCKKHLSQMGFMEDFYVYVEGQIQTYKNRNVICNGQIEMFREKCEHKFEYEGHDSHYSYEKCKYCGKIDKT